MIVNKMMNQNLEGMSACDLWAALQVKAKGTKKPVQQPTRTHSTELVVMDNGRKMTDTDIARMIGQVVGQKVADAMRRVTA